MFKLLCYDFDMKYPLQAHVEGLFPNTFEDYLIVNVLALSIHLDADECIA